jgi:hypothetical protein
MVGRALRGSWWLKTMVTEGSVNSEEGGSEAYLCFRAEGKVCGGSGGRVGRMKDAGVGEGWRPGGG